MFVASARRTLLALAAPLLLGPLAAGCSGSEPPKPQSVRPTPLNDLDTTAITVPRIDFCSFVPKTAVTDALGGKPDDAQRWGNGDVATLTNGTRDVVNELGCEWRTDDGTSARAWVFARPVAEPFARTLVAAAARDRGCRAQAESGFGNPSVHQACSSDLGERRRRAGLFGQSWLSCEVAVPPGGGATVDQRADAWCVQVLNALDRIR